MLREFTATAYIVHDGRILLVRHAKFNKWMPPGGHVDPNETPCEAAVREVMEESGLTVELVDDNPFPFSLSNGRSLVRPLQIALFDIPEWKGTPAHQHVDHAYLARPIGAIPTGRSTRWFTRSEVEGLVPGQDVFSEAQKLILRLL